MRNFYKFILRLLGWKAVGAPAPEDKCIILGVPHTSIWDFIISFLYYNSQGQTANVMVKKELFFWPLSPFLKAMGGIPIDRKKGAAPVRQLIEAFQTNERLHLAIAIEGTRERTSHWKTGFHTIAKAANVPVYLGYFDWGKKEVGKGVKFELTDNPQEDIQKIKQWYKEKGVQGKYPDNFTTD